MAGGEAHDLVELHQLVVALRGVRPLPSRLAARHLPLGVDARAAVDPQLLERPFEDLLVELELAADFLRRLALGGERFEDRGEHGRVGVVAGVEELVAAAVDPGVEEDGARRPAVAAGAADLLVVPLDAAGQAGVDHRAHVRLVHPHAEGDGGDDHLQAAGEEVGLHAVARRSGHAGVVGGGGEFHAQLVAQRVRLLARRRVDDRRPPPRFGQHAAHHLAPFARAQLGHLDGDVGAAEAVDEAPPALVEPELAGDVVLDERGGGRGERHDRRRAQQRQALAEHPVLGAEVVPPLRDAVRLVDRDQNRLALGEHLGEAGDREALRRDEQEVEAARQVVDAGLARRGAVAAGMDALGGEADLAQLRHLVLHEGDERRDDQGGAAAREARELVAERLAGAGRHDEQDVLPRGQGAADVLLVGAEGLEAEG